MKKRATATGARAIAFARIDGAVPQGEPVARGGASKDGLHHMRSRENCISQVCGALSLAALAASEPAASAATSVSLGWLDSLPSPDSPVMHDCYLGYWRTNNSRVLVAELHAWLGRQQDALMWAQVSDCDFILNSESCG